MSEASRAGWNVELAAALPSHGPWKATHEIVSAPGISSGWVRAPVFTCRGLGFGPGKGCGMSKGQTWSALRKSLLHSGPQFPSSK